MLPVVGFISRVRTSLKLKQPETEVLAFAHRENEIKTKLSTVG